MFARAYYPGRSGQIMIVPAEGSIIVSQKDPVVKFMHGSPWVYDTHIPLLFYGTSYVRQGTYPRVARQQDVMPTLAHVLKLPVPPTVTGRPLIEALLSADDVPDLVLVNFKTPDFVAHQYGPDSPEMRETLAELDRQFTRLVQALELKSPGRFLMALTADHGMPGEPSGKALRVYTEDIVKLVHDRFDPEGQLVAQYEPENNQIAIDLNRLEEVKHTLDEIAQLLERQPFIFAAFTEDDIRRATVSKATP